MPLARASIPQAGSLSAIIDAFPFTIFWKDRRSVYLGCNEVFARWAGLPDAQSAAGKSDLDLSWAAKAERYRTEDQRVIQSGEPLYAFDEGRTAPDGSTVLMRRIKVPVRNARGEITGVAGIGEVIDARGHDAPQAEAQLRLLAENAAHGMVVIQDGKLVLANARARMLAGRSAAEVESLSMEQLLHPADRERVMADYRGILEGKPSERGSLYELRIQDKTGRVAWIQASTVLLPWRGRAASLHFIVDVTAPRRQRQLQEALNRASTAMLYASTPTELYQAVSRELILVGVTLFAFTLDPAGNTLTITFQGLDEALVRETERRIGTQHSAVALSVDSVAELREVIVNRKTLLVTDPEKTLNATLPPELRGYSAEIHRLLSISRVIIAPVVLQDGVLGAMALGSPDLDSGDLPAVTAFALHMGAGLHRTRLSQEIAQENAERRQAQEESARLHAAIEQAAEYVLVTDCEGTITYVNPAFQRVTGYTREEAIGRNPRLLKSGKQDPAFYTSLWRTLKSGNVWRGKLMNRRKDGTTYSEEGTISPVKDHDGQTVSYVAVKHDVTHALELEESLRQAQKMEAVGRLAGGVAHDFNNILTTIMGFSDLLLTSLGDHDPRAAEVREILNAAHRASGLTRQLLTFSRKEVTARSLTNLNAVIENVSVMLRRLIGEDIRLVCDLEPGLWPILADTGQIEQVILNLSVNARDAMPQGGTLMFRTRNLAVDPLFSGSAASAGDRVVLSVRDTGTGMDREVRAHLFEPFFTTKKPGVGTGLGLATVYGVVDQSHGRIEVDSEPGHGTEFRLFFPRQDGVAGEASPPDSVELPRGKETILLVEDEAAVRSLTRTLLASWGYSVLEAADPTEALQIAGQKCPSVDLLLTDVVMPGMRGSELASRICQVCSPISVLFMSGYPDDEGLGIGRPGSGVHFLAKPFSPESLARKVREAIDDT